MRSFEPKWRWWLCVAPSRTSGVVTATKAFGCSNSSLCQQFLLICFSCFSRVNLGDLILLLWVKKAAFCTEVNNRRPVVCESVVWWGCSTDRDQTLDLNYPKLMQPARRNLCILEGGGHQKLFIQSQIFLMSTNLICIILDTEYQLNTLKSLSPAFQRYLNLLPLFFFVALCFGSVHFSDI